ncbi:hypothetical protein Pint_27170 [Pistacia integerrima]|uniref:Uncharacterized protein n=1 Tax=Pistacia integerrima TaxID=434235 RepID=A0ACC0YT63_9ROSI|nr:hypothetical protein Pint_27170 [Pistacia integerrima]
MGAGSNSIAFIKVGIMSPNDDIVPKEGKKNPQTGLAGELGKVVGDEDVDNLLLERNGTLVHPI